jgi:hypothetical protein
MVRIRFPPAASLRTLAPTRIAKAYTSAWFKTDTTALIERVEDGTGVGEHFKLPQLLLLGGEGGRRGGRSDRRRRGAGRAISNDARARQDKIKDQLK